MVKNSLPSKIDPSADVGGGGVEVRDLPGGEPAPEDDLRARARELETIMELVPAVIFVANDPACQHIRTNRLGRELLRLSDQANASKTAPSEDVPTTFRVFKDGLEIPPDQLPVQRAARGEVVRHFEEDIVFQDGTVRHWFGNATPLLGDDGQPSGAVAAFIDITERKRAEVALAESARQKDALYRLVDRLHRTDSLRQIYDAALRAIVSAVQCQRASVLLFDASGVMRFVGWYGLSAEYRAAAEGHSPWKPHEENATPICVADVELADFEPTLKARIQAEGIRALGFIPLVSGGRLIGKFMTYFDQPHTFSADEIEMCLTIARQLAFAIDRKRAETALREADRRKDEFLAMLAHELRNPLAPISNAVQLLARSSTDDAVQQQARAIIERQTERLARLVDDLLEVSRISSGRIQLHRERTALRGILERAIETVRPLLDKHGHTLQVELSFEPLWVDADAARLEQVFVNLLNNAAKYTEDGGRIEVSMERSGQYALARVRDSGVGIDAELLPYIFDLFTQGQRSLDRAQGGLGIGLSLVRRIVAMHEGTVEVTSQPGRGSEFCVRLPLTGAKTQERSSDSEERGLTPGSPLDVLIVDDNIDAANSMGLLLQGSGHLVRLAHDGESALRLASVQMPEVVFLDIGLPGMNGYEVAARLRNDPAARDVLIVALTGYGQPADRDRSAAAGFDKHLVKPADYTTIERILAAAARR